MSLPSDAYGVVCLDLPVLLNSLQDVGMTVLECAGRQLSTTAITVADAAADYAAVDEHNLLALHRAMEVR